jgi:hypothetical protein
LQLQLYGTLSAEKDSGTHTRYAKLYGVLGTSRHYIAANWHRDNAVSTLYIRGLIALYLRITRHVNAHEKRIFGLQM